MYIFYRYIGTVVGKNELYSTIFWVLIYKKKKKSFGQLILIFTATNGVLMILQ